MSDVVNIFQALVKNNSEKKSEDYRFPLLDSIIHRDKPYLLDISGDSDSLKTRLSLYLANSLMLNGYPVYWISASDYNPILVNLEVQFPERMLVVLDNDLYRILGVLRQLPDGSDVFLDSIVSLYTEVSETMDHPYLTFGKSCSEIVQKKNLKLHIITPTSGMSGKPLTDIFDRKIQYRIRTKKMNSFKDFVGNNYQVVGSYYQVSSGSTSQVIPAGLFRGIDTTEILFFWLVAVGKILRHKRTYMYQDQAIGSSFKKICQNKDLLQEIFTTQ